MNGKKNVVKSENKGRSDFIQTMTANLPKLDGAQVSCCLLVCMHVFRDVSLRVCLVKRRQPLCVQAMQIGRL